VLGLSLLSTLLQEEVSYGHPKDEIESTATGGTLVVENNVRLEEVYGTEQLAPVRLAKEAYVRLIQLIPKDGAFYLKTTSWTMPPLTPLTAPMDAKCCSR
jgi:hypothetical protein